LGEFSETVPLSGVCTTKKAVFGDLMVDLAAPVRKRIETLLSEYLACGIAPIDFDRPLGAPSLFAPDSVSWRIFKNPMALYIGGMTAVILELAEPRVRAGIWDHTSFRSAPLRRIRRTAFAALATVYGPRDQACDMIARVRAIHNQIKGTNELGEEYSASDPELLTWVHATASYGFSEAYHQYVMPLRPCERDRLFNEAHASAELHGAPNVPRSLGAFGALQDNFFEKLCPSGALMTFIEMMERIHALPGPTAKFEPLFVKAAISLVPSRVRMRLGLLDQWNLGILERKLVWSMGVLADNFLLRNHPAVRACGRLGLPQNYLYVNPHTNND
jgi:uncharacterized protein (DUF2236 family)